GEAHALGARHEPADPLAPLDFLLVAGAVVGAAQGLRAHRVRDLPGTVSEEQRAVTHPVVDVAVTVDVPLVGALRAGDVERKRLHPAVVVRHRVGEEAPGALVQGARGGQGLGVAVLELGRGGETGHENSPLAARRYRRRRYVTPVVRGRSRKPAATRGFDNDAGQRALALTGVAKLAGKGPVSTRGPAGRAWARPSSWSRTRSPPCRSRARRGSHPDRRNTRCASRCARRCCRAGSPSA